MSETEQDDAKRRQRARFVDALTSTVQQPGEHSRLGIRVAGAIAVLALVAGGTLGMGAWHSYKADADAKDQKLAAEQAAALRKLTQSLSRPASPTPTKPAEPAQPTSRPGAQAPYVVPAAPAAPPSQRQPTPTAEKPKEAPRALVLSDRSGVLLKNAATGMCADLPFIGPGKYTIPIIQSHCTDQDDNQRWNMQVHRGDTGPGGASLVLFVNARDGLCMDVPDRVPKPAGTLVQEANCHSILEDNELWWLDPTGDGTVRIRNYMSNQLCLQVEGESRVGIDQCDLDGDSRWRLTG